MFGVEIRHLMHFCLKCVKSALEGPWGGLGPSATRSCSISLPLGAGRVDPAVPDSSSMTNSENRRDVCHGRAVKSASSLGMRNLHSCSTGLPAVCAFLAREHLPAGPGREAGREAEGKQAGRQGYPASSMPEGWESREKTEGAVVCHPTPFNLARASMVGRGFEHPWLFIHRLCAGQAVKPLFG